VPYEAAVEHARLVPQAELQLVDTSHFMVFQDPQIVASALLPFWARVEAGSAVTRATADAARITASQQPLDVTRLPQTVGIAAFATAALLAVSTFVSEDLASISAGVLVAQGRIDFLTAVLACFIGIFIGDLLTMLAGRYFGRAALSRAPLRWMLKPDAVDRAAAWFSKRETLALFLCRFLPGTRVAVYFVAGMFSKRPAWVALCLALAAALWVPLIVGGASLLGGMFVERLFTGNVLLNLLMAALGLYVLLRLLIALATHEGRRGLVGFLTRWRRWEFWPMWAFYPPVIVYVLGLALKHRGFTFTASNPGIPASGIVGESKIDILRALGHAHGFVATAALIRNDTPLEKQLAEAHAFMSAHGLSFPIALKPDRGERGAGVSIARDAAQLENHLRHADEHTVIQAYVPGREFGVFYVRHPDQPAGRIFRITDKRMPALTGDGVRTLRRLILDDPRAVAMADHYIRVQGARADEVIPVGELVQLVELGTHSRGAIFLDGTHLATPALTAVIDTISQGFDGFFFGRYDIRAADEAAFAAGQGFKVIELNGVTSEATSIYDPRYSLFDAYRTLFEQWRLAFEIGAANRRRGAGQLTLRALLQLIQTRGR
jgi:membrane protein DedA with SNARE-associated domain